MKNRLTKKEKLKNSAKNFNRELKKSINTAIVAAFGFLMALAWRDVITEYINELSTIGPVQSKLISALIITLISVIGILIITKYLRVEDN